MPDLGVEADIHQKANTSAFDRCDIFGRLIAVLTAPPLRPSAINLYLPVTLHIYEQCPPSELFSVVDQKAVKSSGDPMDRIINWCDNSCGRDAPLHFPAVVCLA
jgi:hypothetical protein